MGVDQTATFGRSSPDACAGLIAYEDSGVCEGGGVSCITESSNADQIVAELWHNMPNPGEVGESCIVERCSGNRV